MKRDRGQRPSRSSDALSCNDATQTRDNDLRRHARRRVLPPGPITPYAAAKAAAETGILAVHPKAVVARTSLIIGHGPSVHERLVHELAAGTTKGALYSDDIRCPVHVSDLAAALLELADGSAAGSHHVAGSDALSRHQLGVLIADRDGLDASRLPARRRADSTIPGPLDVRLDSQAGQRLLPEAESLLDVDCGSGGHLSRFADSFGHVEGLELSEDMVQLARKNTGVPIHRATCAISPLTAPSARWEHVRRSGLLRRRRRTRRDTPQFRPVPLAGRRHRHRTLLASRGLPGGLRGHRHGRVGRAYLRPRLPLRPGRRRQPHGGALSGGLGG
ncbi:sugar nucleotide-binding protein [Streptomyces sp. SCSIO-PteL053]|nr:sugar nucleotide-binding protein [Streptomyces sp. SCSIO-PteL053]